MKQLVGVRRWYCCWLWPGTPRMCVAEERRLEKDGRTYRVYWSLERPLIESDRLLISERGLFATYYLES